MRIAFRLTKEQKERIELKSNLLGFGSISEYARYVLCNFEPNDRQILALIEKMDSLITKLDGKLK